MSDSASPSPAPQGQPPDTSKSLVPALQEVKKVSLPIPPEVLKEIPPDILDKIKGVIVRQEHTHTEFSMKRSSPLPPPSELAAYNEIIPQGADRLLKMVEAQSAHRINIESNVVNSQQGQESKGQFFGFIIGIVGLLCGSYVAICGQPLAGAGIAGTPLVGLVSVFLYSKHRDTAELAEKKEEMDAVEPKPSPNQDRKNQKKNKNRRR
jgi:uncharacterized membrane protein